jgi:hypothetical protein
MHNCLMDSGASHNLMPKNVMDRLGLEITKTYHDLYSFDSRKAKCLGVIEGLVVTLFQLPMKSVVMDIVVANVTPKFGMLLSRYWIKRLGGTFQMDISYEPTNSTKKVTTTNKENEAQKNQPVIKDLVPEIKEILKSPSSFSFENEIHKIKIPVPFLELIKIE